VSELNEFAERSSGEGPVTAGGTRVYGWGPWRLQFHWPPRNCCGLQYLRVWAVLSAGMRRFPGNPGLAEYPVVPCVSAHPVLTSSCKWKEAFRPGIAHWSGVVSSISHDSLPFAPHETFGAAGWLWLAGIAPSDSCGRKVARREHNCSAASGLPAWRLWEGSFSRNPLPPRR